jgi:hypothetical protein
MKIHMTFIITLLVSIAANLRAADKERPPLADLPLPERWLAMDEDGWTVVKPAADSRLIYVSSSEAVCDRRVWHRVRSAVDRGENGASRRRTA